MPADTPPAAPRALPGRLAALREDLAAASYTSEHVEELLGPMAVAALGREQSLPALRVLRTVEDPAGDLLRLLTLGDDLPAARLDRALPRLGAEGARELGLVDLTAGTATALVDLAPYAARDDLGEISWWIASDRSELATGSALGPEHVLGVGGASLTLAQITPRASVGSVLDMGCGCGIQAMHASRHAERVVATDLSERALAFAAFNAALNGIDLDLRAGSLFGPVAGERFDLVVSNPPFVITPRDAGIAAWTYRDGGARGDALLARIVADLPLHLAPGGTAVMLANWEIGEGSSWDEHPRAWFARTGLDAWVIQRETEDPAQYAETWARDGGVTDKDPAWVRMLGAWLDDFASREVSAIGFGYVLARRPAVEAPAPLLRTEEVATAGSGSLGAHLGATLAAWREVAALSDEQLLARRAERAEDLLERRHLTPGAWDPRLIELVQGAGLGRTVRADRLLAGTVGACDGELTLSQIIAAVCALTDAEPEDATGTLVPALREMLTTGMLRLLPEARPA